MEQHKTSMRCGTFMVIGAFLLLLVSGCGGGDSANDGGGDTTHGASGANEPIILQGVVAAGQPLAGYFVTVTSLGNSFHPGQETTADAQGRYAITLGIGMEPPFLIAARKIPVGGAYPHLHSFSSRGGTTNITPLTSLLVAQLRQAPVFYNGFGGDDEYRLATVTEEQLAVARQKVVDYLLTRPNKYDRNVADPIDASPIADFVRVPFQPAAGDSYDDVLEKLNQSLLTTETIVGIEERMLNKDAPPTDLSKLASGVSCDGNVCGEITAGPLSKIGDARIPKFSLIKQLSVQLVHSPFPLQMDCGPSPEIKGFRAGGNMFWINDGIVYINSRLSGDSTLYDLLSVSEMSASIDVHADTNTNYFIRFGGMNGIGESQTGSIGLTFDSDGNVSAVAASERQGDTWKYVECKITSS